MRLSPPAALHPVVLAVRRRLGQSRLLWWGLVLGTALAAAWLVHGVQRDADRRRDAWGEGVPVLVARRDLVAGEPLDASTVEVDTFPRAVVPPGTLDTVPEAGAVAVTPVHAGEMVHAARSGPAPGGLGSLLPPGTVGIAVPVDPASLAALTVTPGSPVDVLTTDPVSGQPSLGAGGARVVSTGEGVVVVAVPEGSAPAVAAAAASGSASVVLRPAP